jgi:hypothetical protein
MAALVAFLGHVDFAGEIDAGQTIHSVLHTHEPEIQD